MRSGGRGAQNLEAPQYPFLYNFWVFIILKMRPYMNCGPLPSLLTPNSSLLTVICKANDKKSAHEEKVRYRLCNLVCRYMFLRCGFSFSCPSQPLEGESHIFYCTRKKIVFYFLHLWTGVVPPGALMVFTIGKRTAASAVLCIFMGSLHRGFRFAYQ